MRPMFQISSTRNVWNPPLVRQGSIIPVSFQAFDYWAFMTISKPHATGSDHSHTDLRIRLTILPMITP